MSRSVLAGAALIFGTNVTAQAQEIVYWPAPVAPSTTGERYHFPMGTPVALVTRTQISTKNNKPGDRIYFEVAESLSFRGQIVVPVGALAVGEVARSERNGHVGKKGKLDIRLLYAQTPSGPVRLTGRSYDEGKSGTVASVATMALLSGLGFFIHGTSGYIQPGTPVQGYLADPLHFTHHQQQSSQSVITAQPERQQKLPATFDPSVFGGAGPYARSD